MSYAILAALDVSGAAMREDVLLAGTPRSIVLTPGDARSALGFALEGLAGETEVATGSFSTIVGAEPQPWRSFWGEGAGTVVAGHALGLAVELAFAPTPVGVAGHRARTANDVTG